MKIARIESIKSFVRDMENGVFDFTNNGKCTNCGECCSNFLPVSAKELKEIRRYILKNHVSEQRHILPSVQAADFTCPFRDGTGKKCTIYLVRPAICRDFKCDKPAKKINANKSLYHGKYRIVNMRKEFFGIN